jgi:hypothetical protein
MHPTTTTTTTTDGKHLLHMPGPPPLKNRTNAKQQPPPSSSNLLLHGMVGTILCCCCCCCAAPVCSHTCAFQHSVCCSALATSSPAHNTQKHNLEESVTPPTQGGVRCSCFSMRGARIPLPTQATGCGCEDRVPLCKGCAFKQHGTAAKIALHVSICLCMGCGQHDLAP